MLQSTYFVFFKLFFVKLAILFGQRSASCFGEIALVFFYHVFEFALLEQRNLFLFVQLHSNFDKNDLKGSTLKKNNPSQHQKYYNQGDFYKIYLILQV